MELVRYRRAEGLRIFGHPAHAVAVHLPIGLLPASTAWDALAVAGLGGEGVFWRVSFWTLAAGLVTAVPAVATGFADFLALVRDPASGRTSERAADVAVYHLMTMLAAASAYGGSFLARGGPGPPEGSRFAWALGLAGAGVLLLAVGGWLGGHLVYGHGVGVRRSPEHASDPPGGGSE